MDRGNKVQRALVPPRPVRLNVNAEVPTPFVVPWSWYIKQRLYWQLPKLLSVAVSADGQQDETRYAGLVHEDVKFGLSVSFNQTAALDKYAGYHLVSVKKISHTELHFTLSRAACPCHANKGAPKHPCGCGRPKGGCVGASLPDGAVEAPDEAERPASRAGTWPHGAGSASVPTVQLAHGHQKRVMCKDSSQEGNPMAEIDPSSGPRICIDRASSGGAPFCGQAVGADLVSGRAASGKAPSVQGGAAGRSASRARSGGSGTTGSTHSTATAAGAPGGSADGGLPEGPQPGAGAKRASADGTQAGAWSRRRRPQGGSLQRRDSRTALCSGTGAEGSSSGAAGSDGISSSSGSEDGDDSDESAGPPEQLPNNPFRKDYCSCPCHVWRKYWPDPDDPAKHQDDMDLNQQAGSRGRRRQVRSRARAGSDVEDESDDDDQNDEDWRAGSVRGCKRRATALPEAGRPARRARAGGAVAGKPPQPPRALTAPSTAAAMGLGQGQQRLDAAPGGPAQLPPLPPSAAAAVSQARRGSSGGSAGPADGSGRRHSGGVGVLSFGKPTGAAAGLPTGPPDHLAHVPTPAHAPSHAKHQQQNHLVQHAGTKVKCQMQDENQPAQQQTQEEAQPAKQPAGQQRSAQTVITSSDSDDEVDGRRHDGHDGSGSGELVVQGARGDHVSVEEDEADGRAAGDGLGAHSDGDEQPLASFRAEDQHRRQLQPQNAQQQQQQRDCRVRTVLDDGRDVAGGTAALPMATLSLSPNHKKSVATTAGRATTQSQRQQTQTQRGKCRGSVAARITAAAAARARRTGATSPGVGTISASPLPQPARASAVLSPQAAGAASAEALPRPVSAAAEVTSAQPSPRDAADAACPGHTTAANTAPAAGGSGSVQSAHTQPAPARGQVVVRRISGDCADVSRDLARQCGGGGGDDGSVLPTGLQVSVDGAVLPQIHPVTWTAPDGEAGASGDLLRLQGIPGSCAGMQLQGWTSSGKPGVLLLQVGSTEAEATACPGPAAGGVAPSGASARAAVDGTARQKRRREEDGLDGGDEGARCGDRDGPTLPPRPSGLQKQALAGVGRVEPDRKSRPGAQHKQQRGSAPPPPQRGLPLPLPPPLVVSLPDRPICRPGWDVVPLESGASMRPRKGTLITDSRLPLDPTVLHDRQGRGTCFMRLFVERDGLLDGYTAAKCVVVEDNSRGATLDRLPSHARNCTFLGWGVLPGGSLVLRVESASPAGRPAGGTASGAVWPQPEAVAAAAAAAAPIAAEMETRRRHKCEGRFRSPAAKEAATLQARGKVSGPSGGGSRKVVPVAKVLSYAPALPSQLHSGPLRGSGAVSGRHGPEQRRSGGGAGGSGGGGEGGGGNGQNRAAGASTMT